MIPDGIYDEMVIRDGVLVTYRGAAEEIAVPEGTVGIGDKCFRFHHLLRRVSLPESVTWIGKSAFYDCLDLQEVSLPEGLARIGPLAFAHSSLREIRIPGSVRVLEDAVFFKCPGLKRAVLEEGVTAIGSSAFSCCSELTEVRLPSSLRSIGEEAFFCCGSLERPSLPKGVRLGSSAFSGCEKMGDPEGFVIFKGILFENLKQGGDLVIPSRVKVIDRAALRGNYDVFTVTLPNSVMEIGRGAFSECLSLTAFRPEGRTWAFQVRDGVLFDWTGEKLLSYPPGKKDASYRVPDGTRRIAFRAFYRCKALKELILPEGLRTLEQEAVCETGLSLVRLPDSLDRLGDCCLERLPAICRNPRAASRIPCPVYLGDPGDLPEADVEKACMGFYRAHTAGMEEAVPFLGAYRAVIRDHGRMFAEKSMPGWSGTWSGRPFLIWLLQGRMLPLDVLRELLEKKALKKDLEIRAMVLACIGEEEGGFGAGDLTLDGGSF